MSLLVVGISYRSAPMDLLEQTALTPEAAEGLAGLARRQDDVAEALVVATCNRTEVYAEAHTFHGALTQLGESLCRATGVTVDELTEHLYVHYEDRAVSHLFSLACGLESMAVGESQVLGQLRDALASAQRAGHVGTVLNGLFQRALRVGKRAHTETAIDDVSRSLVTVGLDRARTVVPDLTRARTLLIGAGAMSGLAAATLARAGVTDLTVVNRTRERAERLVAAHGGRAGHWTDLGDELERADLVVTCTGSVGHVIDADLVRQARGGSSSALAVLDLAMPRDVDPMVAVLDDVHVWGLAELRPALADRAADADRTDAVLAEVEDLVTAEVATFLTDRRVQQVGPTVAALRARAATLVEAEMARLDQRLPGLGEREAAEMRRTVQRVVDKLLHTPTIRVKELVSDAQDDYAHALRELFDLDPHDVAAVSVPPRGGGVDD